MNKPQHTPIKPRGSSWKRFLFVTGLLVTITVLVIGIRAVLPYLPFIGLGLVSLLGFLACAGILWVCLSLYGMWQEQLAKRDSRSYVRVPKDEQLVIRHPKTRQLMPLEQSESTPIPYRASGTISRQAMMPPIEPDVPPPAPRREPPVASPAPSSSATTPPKLPTIYYASIRDTIRPGQVVIGIRPDDWSIRVGAWDDLKTLLVLGAMASGKTNTIAEKTCEAAHGGAWLVVCDPHAHKPDSLYQRVLPLSGYLFPGSVLAMTHEEILLNVELVHNELERRVNGGGYTRPLVLVVDEWNRLQRDEMIAHELMLIATILGQEGRGFGVYGIFGAQRITYNVDLRKSVIARIVHRCDESEAKLVLPQRYARLAPELPNGLSLVMDADGTVELLQQAMITQEDIALLASQATSRQPLQRQAGTATRATVKLNRELFPHTLTRPNVPKREERPIERRLARLIVDDTPTVPEQETPFETPKKTTSNGLNVSPTLQAEIIRLAKTGMSRRKIKDQLGLHGGRYEIIRRVLDDAGL